MTPTPTGVPVFAATTPRPRSVREERAATGWGERRPGEPWGERFTGEAVLRDLPRMGAEAMAALRILARYTTVRALETTGEPAAKEARRAAFAYLAALEGAEEAQALRRALVAPAGSAARFAALMGAAREAERWEQWHGAWAVRRLAWSAAVSAGRRTAAARAARALALTCRQLGRTAEARQWRRRWRGCREAEAS